MSAEEAPAEKDLGSSSSSSGLLHQIHTAIQAHLTDSDISSESKDGPPVNVVDDGAGILMNVVDDGAGLPINVVDDGAGPAVVDDGAGASLPPAEEEQDEHANGSCNPCVFYTIHRGCSKGDQCCYCHLPHEDRQKPAHRPRKQTREKYKQTVQSILEAYQDQPDLLHDQLQELAKKSPYIRAFLSGYLESVFSPPAATGGAYIRTPGLQPASAGEPSSSSEPGKLSPEAWLAQGLAEEFAQSSNDLPGSSGGYEAGSPVQSAVWEPGHGRPCG